MVYVGDFSTNRLMEINKILIEWIILTGIHCNCQNFQQFLCHVISFYLCGALQAFIIAEEADTVVLNVTPVTPPWISNASSLYKTTHRSSFKPELIIALVQSDSPKAQRRNFLLAKSVIESLKSCFPAK